MQTALTSASAPQPDGERTEPQPGWLWALFDWGPVVAIAVVSQTKVGLESPWTASDLELAITSLATALPLAWRRSRPVAASAAVGAALCLQVLVIGGSLHFGSFCAALIAMYSVARHAQTRLAAGIGGLVLAAGIAGANSPGLMTSPADVVFPLFYFTAAWFLGRGALTLERRADSLRQLNDALERERENQARLAVVSERLRLARELHDVVAHTVMLMVVQAEAAEETLADDPVATRRSLDAVQAAGRRGMDDLRNLVGVLREDGLSENELVPGLVDLDTLRDRMRDSGLAVELHRSGDLDTVPPALQSSVFRVVQEALTNILKHSLASHSTVSLVVDHGRIRIDVVDPGPVRTAPHGPGGHGLAGMRERMSAHGGFLEAGSTPVGFRVRAEAPLPAASR